MVKIDLQRSEVKAKLKKLSREMNDVTYVLL
jgi:hypothetical protein